MKFLKFPDRAACIDAFAPYLATDAHGDMHMPSYIGHSAVDEVGTIYRATGTTLTTPDGFAYPEMARRTGWHVNLSGDECPPDLVPYLIMPPATPSRVFA